MFDWLEDQFGAEPFLGITVLAVSLPIVGALAYITFISVWSAPWTFAAYMAPWLIFLLCTLVFDRLPETLRRTLERLLYWIFIAFAVIWFCRSLIRVWRDSGLFSVLIWLTVFPVSWAFSKLISWHTDRIDYRQRWRD